MKQELNEKIKEIDTALLAYLPERENPQRRIYEAMRYSIFAGGKRLRPILMLETCKMCGGRAADAMPFACAMEMIHTYSLIHDDLPAMDNDNLRRGLPTNHIQFGESTAILAGDALLNKAFEIVSEECPQSVQPQRWLKAVHLLAVSSGTEGMVGGQVVDLAAEGKAISLEDLKYIHSLKTGAIIRSACVIGAYLAGVSEDACAAVDRFALNLGIAFQIQDDILDVSGNDQELGKPVGSDSRRKKNTYVSLCGLEKARMLCRQYSQDAIAALASFGERAGFLTRLTEYLIDRHY